MRLTLVHLEGSFSNSNSLLPIGHFAFSFSQSLLTTGIHLVSVVCGIWIRRFEALVINAMQVMQNVSVLLIPLLECNHVVDGRFTEVDVDEVSLGGIEMTSDPRWPCLGGGIWMISSSVHHVNKRFVLCPCWPSVAGRVQEGRGEARGIDKSEKLVKGRGDRVVGARL